MYFSSVEVSFDERIALELDALDQLGTVESPESERQMISFQKSQLNGGNEEDNSQQLQNAFDKSIDVRRVEPVVEQPEQCQALDCDEIRIMIKVLGSKVCKFLNLF